MILAFELVLPYGVWWGNSQHHLLDLGLFLSFLKPNADLYQNQVILIELVETLTPSGRQSRLRLALLSVQKVFQVLESIGPVILCIAAQLDLHSGS